MDFKFNNIAIFSLIQINFIVWYEIKICGRLLFADFCLNIQHEKKSQNYKLNTFIICLIMGMLYSF